MRKLLEKRTAIVAEMRTLTASPAGEGGDLSAEQETRFNSLKGELEALEKRIERQALIDESERRSQGYSVSGSTEFEREKREFSLIRAIQKTLGAPVDAGRELEISTELARQEQRSTDGILAPYNVFERRVDPITTTTPASGPGSNLIGTDHLGGQYIDLLREANPFSGVGVRTISGLVGNLEIPKGTSSTAVGWVAENSAFPDTDAAFGKVTLSPKHVGALTSYSRNMLLQSSPDIESLLRSDLAQVLALEVARATINGTGTNAEPLGILNQAGIQEVAAPTDAMQYAPVLADALFTANVRNVAFLANSGFKLTVDQLLTTDGLPIGAAVFFRAYPHIWTSLVPADRIMIAGDFSDIIQGTWSSVEILVNPYMESAYKKGNVALRIILTMDVAVRHPESFAVFEEEEAAA
jgi:HK97 family phage major capsid protein